MMQPFTRRDFDQPHEHHEPGPLIVQQACHPRAGLKMTYQELEAGVLEVYCYLCEKPVVRIRVA